MEYIDNSIDSAEAYYKAATNSYSRKINISLTLRKGSVVIDDNCYGITNFIKIVQKVGNSDKKAQPWTNGQFGYGIYSFMAACGKLDIVSKQESKDHGLSITINKEQFNEDHQDDVRFPIPKKCKFNNQSGTKIILSDFEKDMWKQIDFKEIKNEIEKHFELLLARKNLEILLINDVTGEKYLCQPFNYDQYEGEIYPDELHTLKYIEGRKHPVVKTLNTLIPIKIFLKIIKGKTINKPPIFISKGRRIEEIRNIKLFRSKHKSDIWGHPNMTGYIDLSDFLEPTMARNDFKNNERSRALFYTLEELEPLILAVIQEVNKVTDDQHYKVLEDRLNAALAKLAKIDSMNFRSSFMTGNDIPLGKNSESVEADKNNTAKKDEKNDSIEKPTDEKEKKLPPADKHDELFDDPDYKSSEKKKSGFDIRIVDSDPPVDENDKMLRSQLIGGSIRVFRKHPEFEERVQRSMKGEVKISQRLISYLACEITVHYKDMLQTRYGQPEYNKKLFENMVEFIYQFESILRDLAGKNLSELG